MFNNLFGSTEQRDDSARDSVDDDLEEERIYNQTIACITNTNTYINKSGPYSYMYQIARAYVGNGVGHMLPEALASTMGEVLFVRLSQLELLQSRSQQSRLLFQAQHQLTDHNSYDFNRQKKRRVHSNYSSITASQKKQS